MKTVTPTPEEMRSRIARFNGLTPIQAQREEAYPLPVLDLIYARKLLPVIGLGQDNDTQVSDAAPIQGAAGMTITYAICPPGQGPSLHAHQQTYETFTVLRGTFEFSWGDRGEHAVVLNQFDVLSVPPEICRAFKNIGTEEGILQVIITGGVHDMDDIDLSPQIGEMIDKIDPEIRQKIERERFTFTAGIE